MESRLAISGFGLAGQRHAEAIARADGVSLVAVAEPSWSAGALAKAGDAARFDTLGALLADAAPDGVIVATPTPLHVSQAETCVAHGVPVLVEKPVATATADVPPLLRQAAARDVPILVGHHRRHNPLVQRAKDILGAGQIGDIRAVQATCWFYKPDSYFDAAPWRKQAGAGPVSLNLVHDIDLMRYLCGEIVWVQAAGVPSRRGFDNEDVAAALVRFASGAVGTITVADSIAAPWSWELTSGENPAHPYTRESCYWLGGARGSLSIPDLRLWTHAGMEPDWWRPISATWWRPMSATTAGRTMADPLVNQIHHFCQVIRRQAEPLVSGTEGLRTLQVTEAIQRAIATGQPASLAPAAPPAPGAG